MTDYTQKAERDALVRSHIPFDDQGSTHWDGCEQEHWKCALVHLRRACDTLETRAEAAERLWMEHAETFGWMEEIARSIINLSEGYRPLICTDVMLLADKARTVLVVSDYAGKKFVEDIARWKTVQINERIAALEKALRDLMAAWPDDVPCFGAPGKPGSNALSNARAALESKP